jgi:hypothetical protein
MIEQFTVALAKILFNKTLHTHEQLQAKLNNVSSQFLGFNLELLETASYDEILTLFALDGNPDLTRCYIAAELLKEKADLDRHENITNTDWKNNYIKSFVLYFEALSGNEDLQSSDKIAKMETIIN